MAIKGATHGKHSKYHKIPAKPGDKVYLEGTTLNKEVVPTITGGKFGKAIELFATDAECKCMYNGSHMLTESGNITVKTLKNAHIS